MDAASLAKYDLLLNFMRGETQPKMKQLSGQIERVVICGNSMTQHDKVDEVLRGSYRTQELNKEVYSSIQASIDRFEKFLEALTEVVDVDVMPGELDFSNSFLP